MTDRIDLKIPRRYVDVSKYGGIVIIAITLIEIAFSNHSDIKGFRDYFSIILHLFFGSLIVLNSIKTKKKLDQFIEWDDKKVSYKLANQQEPQDLAFELIENVSILFDKIILTLKDNSVQTLDIGIFKYYNDRKKIESKFEALKLNHS